MCFVPVYFRLLHGSIPQANGRHTLELSPASVPVFGIELGELPNGEADGDGLPSRIWESSWNFGLRGVTSWWRRRGGGRARPSGHPSGARLAARRARRVR